MNYEIIPCAEGDADYIEEKINEISDLFAPPEEGAEDDYVLLKVTDDDGNIIGGCIALIDSRKIGDLDILWVDEKYRRQGIGSALIREAERGIREKGGYLMTLGTFDFQARPLYEKHGYTVCGFLEDCPRGHEHYDMVKRLDIPSEEYVPSKICVYDIKAASEEEAGVIEDGLVAYNDSQVPYEHEYKRIERKIVDEEGNLIAGCSAGIIGWNNSLLDTIWVDEPLRGQGIGSYLLRELEKELKDKGAYNVLLSATDWQADFFRKNGYTEYGKVEDCPKGYNEYQLQKLL